jgi:hypothetical protein
MRDPKQPLTEPSVAVIGSHALPLLLLTVLAALCLSLAAAAAPKPTQHATGNPVPAVCASWFGSGLNYAVCSPHGGKDFSVSTYGSKPNQATLIEGVGVIQNSGKPLRQGDHFSLSGVMAPGTVVMARYGIGGEVIFGNFANGTLRYCNLSVADGGDVPVFFSCEGPNSKDYKSYKPLANTAPAVPAKNIAQIKQALRDANLFVAAMNTRDFQLVCSRYLAKQTFKTLHLKSIAACVKTFSKKRPATARMPRAIAGQVANATTVWVQIGKDPTPNIFVLESGHYRWFLPPPDNS